MDEFQRRQVEIAAIKMMMMAMIAQFTENAEDGHAVLEQLRSKALEALDSANLNTDESATSSHYWRDWIAEEINRFFGSITLSPD